MINDSKGYFLPIKMNKIILFFLKSWTPHPDSGNLQTGSQRGREKKYGERESEELESQAIRAEQASLFVGYDSDYALKTWLVSK